MMKNIYFYNTSIQIHKYIIYSVLKQTQLSIPPLTKRRNVNIYEEQNVAVKEWKAGYRAIISSFALSITEWSSDAR
mgnify:CR=1 FL=1